MFATSKDNVVSPLYNCKFFIYALVPILVQISSFSQSQSQEWANTETRFARASIASFRAAMV